MSIPTVTIFLTFNPRLLRAILMNFALLAPLAVRMSNCFPESLTSLPSGVKSLSSRLRIASAL